MVVQGTGPLARTVRAAPDVRDRLMTVRQIAGRLGVSTATVYALVERGELAHLRLANSIRVTERDLSAFVESARQS
jgi:excisionase family DNA binding protein